MSDVPGQSGHALPIGQYPVRATSDHSITSSAAVNSVGGNSSPSDVAAFWLSTSSYFGQPVERKLARLCAPQYLSSHIRYATPFFHGIVPISHEAADIDELPSWVDGWNSKSGREVHDHFTIGEVLARIACNDTIHSIFFYQVERSFVSSSVDIFADHNNGIKSPLVYRSIKKLSADNDNSHLDASLVCGVAHVCALRRRAVGRISCQKPNLRQFSRAFQQQLKALGPDFQSCINDRSGEISVRSR